MKIKFKDNSAAVKRKMAANVQSALVATGELFVDLAQKEIQSVPKFGPGTSGLGAIDTTKMLRSNTFQVNAAAKETTIGNTAFSDRGARYPLYVTFGTWKMPQRPWMQNSVFNHVGTYQKVISTELSRGF